jgi:hypothetical protein
MRKLRAFVIRLRGLFRAKRSEDEFAAELESHVALHIDDGIRAGLTLQEARRQALIRLGGEEQAKQAHRDRRTFPWLESLLRDPSLLGYTLVVRTAGNPAALKEAARRQIYALDPTLAVFLMEL